MEGENQVNELMKKDIAIKIISLIVALYFWFYALNLQDPYLERTLAVPIRIVNESALTQKGIKWVEENKVLTADVVVRGRRGVVDKVRTSDFEVLLDFSQVKSVQDEVLSVSRPTHNYTDISVSLKTSDVRVHLERVIPAEFNVEVEVEGLDELEKKGYRVLEYKPTSTVKLEDIESKIANVGSVKTKVNVSNALEDYTTLSDCTVYDKNGKILTDLSKNINVNVMIKVAKEVPIKLVVNGSPAKDYVETYRDINPKTVLISGSPGVLARISELETEPVNIHNLDRSMSIPVVFKLPAGVKLADATTEVFVNVAVEPLVEKSFVISKYDISLTGANGGGELEYEILSSNVTVWVKGKAKDLEGFNIRNVKPQVNVAALKEGNHTILPEIDLPAGLSLAKSSSVEVKIDSIRKLFIEKESINVLNANNAYKYHIAENGVTVEVKGRKSELDKLSSAVVKPTVDVAGLGPGTHQVPVALTLPPSVGTIQNPMMEITIE